jgi:hypothetical protein
VGLLYLYVIYKWVSFLENMQPFALIGSTITFLAILASKSCLAYSKLPKQRFLFKYDNLYVHAYKLKIAFAMPHFGPPVQNFPGFESFPWVCVVSLYLSLPNISFRPHLEVGQTYNIDIFGSAICVLTILVSDSCLALSTPPPPITICI